MLRRVPISSSSALVIKEKKENKECGSCSSTDFRGEFWMIRTPRCRRLRLGAAASSESWAGLRGPAVASLSKHPPWVSSIHPGWLSGRGAVRAEPPSSSSSSLLWCRAGGLWGFRGSWSSGPASPWCSTACAGWTVWWCRRAWGAALGGNWLRPLAASRWGAGWPPGSWGRPDTGKQRRDRSHFRSIISLHAHSFAPKIGKHRCPGIEAHHSCYNTMKDVYTVCV